MQPCLGVEGGGKSSLILRKGILAMQMFVDVHESILQMLLSAPFTNLKGYSTVRKVHFCRKRFSLLLTGFYIFVENDNPFATGGAGQARSIQLGGYCSSLGKK